LARKVFLLWVGKCFCKNETGACLL